MFNTWSPSLAQPSTQAQEHVYGDGGNVENVHLIGLLQREVPNIILFFNYNFVFIFVIVLFFNFHFFVFLLFFIFN